MLLKHVDRVPSVLDRNHAHAEALQHARHRKNVANVIVHQQYFPPLQQMMMQVLQDLSLSLRELGNIPVQPESRFIEQPLGRPDIADHRPATDLPRLQTGSLGIRGGVNYDWNRGTGRLVVQFLKQIGGKGLRDFFIEH
ncbi:hypothetical protein SDC9_149998 [bioreactor metagenome]|uniref:Uncharacterized protein n=1 Tax=bioreactor metagenome TaxID=1076179 RepID=A0A645END9_9ZZZZ